MTRKRSSNQIKRDERENQRLRTRQRQYIKWGLLAVFGLAVVGVLVWLGTRPATAMGEGVAVTSSEHVEEGSALPPNPSNPPAGGVHYPGTYQPGFYEESQLADLPKEHEGYLVHNLEHGYVIFWYNCEADPTINCGELKQTIRDVMDQAGTDELIAFPWESQKEPLVMTSWDRILRFDKPDPNQMRQFVRLYLNKSPEPAAH